MNVQYLSWRFLSLKFGFFIIAAFMCLRESWTSGTSGSLPSVVFTFLEKQPHTNINLGSSARCRRRFDPHWEPFSFRCFSLWLLCCRPSTSAPCACQLAAFAALSGRQRGRGTATRLTGTVYSGAAGSSRAENDQRHHLLRPRVSVRWKTSAFHINKPLLHMGTVCVRVCVSVCVWFIPVCVDLLCLSHVLMC